ncbi:NAD(P)-binding protein [Neoconidiobolus thromboides FSU 785]|nr:NAD(P)-binding protein [Neoconidiobolus thromboides FSU 785]
MGLKEQVLVSGGTGYLAQQVIFDLLDLGYIVNTTVRKLQDSRCDILNQWKEEFPNQLNIFEADLLKKNSFLPALKGCKAVFHLATPVLFKNLPTDPYEEQVKPAVEGTQNLLESILEIDTITDIIVTSSLSSVYTTFDVKEGYYTEKDFNYNETIESSPYAYSKTQAELKVWEFEKQYSNKYRILTVNPGVIFGPLIGAKQLSINGKESGRAYVDVRDVSEAHIRAYENKNASGRFICNNSSFSWKEFSGILKKLLPNALLPSVINHKSKEEPIPKFDNTKSKEILGINYITLETSIREQLKQFSDLPYQIKD